MDKEIHDTEHNPVRKNLAPWSETFGEQNQVELARTAFGMWANRQDIDDKWLERGRQQWQSEWPDA